MSLSLKASQSAYNQRVIELSVISGSTIGQLIHDLRHKDNNSFFNRRIIRLKNVDADANNQVSPILWYLAVSYILIGDKNEKGDITRLFNELCPRYKYDSLNGLSILYP